MLRLYSNKIVGLGLLFVNVCAFDVTPEKLQKDKDDIRKHIFETVKKDIETSESWWIKTSGAYLVQVSEETYQKRPLPFYYNFSAEAQEIFEQEINKPKVAGHVDRGVKAFLQEKNEVTHDNLGSFLHDRLVDEMKFDKVQNQNFKIDPLAMNEFVKSSDDVVRKRYVKKNVRNFIKHFYLTTYHK